MMPFPARYGASLAAEDDSRPGNPYGLGQYAGLIASPIAFRILRRLTESAAHRIRSIGVGT